MSEEQTKATTEIKQPVEQPTPEVVAEVPKPNNDLDLLVRQREADQKELATMRSHMDKLLGEAKDAKSAKVVAEEDKLKKAGEWKQLHDSQEKEKEAAIEELNTFKAQMSQKVIHNRCLELAATIADNHNVQHIAKDMVDHLRLSGDDIRVVDKATGELTVQTLEEFAQKSYVANPVWASLVRGNQSSGGSATGSSSSATASNEITREQLTKMSPVEQMKIAKTPGIKIID
jgi:hypothetical protein